MYTKKSKLFLQMPCYKTLFYVSIFTDTYTLNLSYPKEIKKKL